MQGCPSAQEPEIMHLSLTDLDVQELERRLELASAAPAADCWTNVCPCNVLVDA
jgi:hypothetical protein